MIYLNGSDIPETDWYGNQMVDNDFILIFNAHYEPIMFTLPDEQYGKKWRLIVDTHNPKGPELNYEAGFVDYCAIKKLPAVDERQEAVQQALQLLTAQLALCRQNPVGWSRRQCDGSTPLVCIC